MSIHLCAHMSSCICCTEGSSTNTFHLQTTMEDPVEHSLAPAATNVRSGKKTKTKKRRHTQSESQERSCQPTGGMIAAFHNIAAN